MELTPFVGDDDIEGGSSEFAFIAVVVSPPKPTVDLLGVLRKLRVLPIDFDRGRGNTDQNLTPLPNLFASSIVSGRFWLRVSGRKAETIMPNMQSIPMIQYG